MSDAPATRLLVGPFNRVEGDLEVQLDVADGQVQSARVHATMYRGFETMLQGKDPLDALVYVPRICGICSVSQSVAAAEALADLAGATMPPNGRHVLNLMLATENLADHLTHFYLFFMPDFAREVYADRPWFAEVSRRFAAFQGEHARAATAARARWFTLLGTLGGKWPHTHAVLPGGSARPVDMAERLRLLAKVREFRAFLEQTLFADRLEHVAAIDSADALNAWWQSADPMRGDLRCFLTLAADTGLARLGLGPGRYLSHGAYRQPDGRPAVTGGVWQPGPQTVEAFDPTQVREDLSHAWFQADTPAHPFDGRTVPDPDKPGAYTWNKAPRLAGQVLETGALARQLIDGHPLMRDMAGQGGGTVLTRVLARLLELARIVPLMEQWLGALQPGEPWHTPTKLPDTGQGCGLTEAARGALGHWLQVEHGRLRSYQIVAPTSWNFSPRDALGQPGALEQALVGAPVLAGERTPVAVQHIVRSFDPCMVCTVH
jgi:hydrogenase large subunit